MNQIIWLCFCGAVSGTGIYQCSEIRTVITSNPRFNYSRTIFVNFEEIKSAVSSDILNV